MAATCPSGSGCRPLLTRLWQSAAGLVTLVLIARHFTPEVQGFHYAFASVLALQSIVELGFYVVITTASHEWAGRRFDEEE